MGHFGHRFFGLLLLGHAAPFALTANVITEVGPKWFLKAPPFVNQKNQAILLCNAAVPGGMDENILTACQHTVDRLSGCGASVLVVTDLRPGKLEAKLSEAMPDITDPTKIPIFFSSHGTVVKQDGRPVHAYPISTAGETAVLTADLRAKNVVTETSFRLASTRGLETRVRNFLPKAPLLIDTCYSGAAVTDAGSPTGASSAAEETTFMSGPFSHDIIEEAMIDLYCHAERFQSADQNPQDGKVDGPELMQFLRSHDYLTKREVRRISPTQAVAHAADVKAHGGKPVSAKWDNGDLIVESEFKEPQSQRIAELDSVKGPWSFTRPPVCSQSPQPGGFVLYSPHGNPAKLISTTASASRGLASDKGNATH